MNARRILILAGGSLLLLGAQLLDAGGEERRQRDQKPMESYLLGHQAVFVDYLWFDLLQYYGGFCMGEHDLSDFNARYERLHSADPSFHIGALFAVLVRAETMEDPEGAVRWLVRSEEENPEHWIYPYEQGFIHYLWLKDYPSAIESFKRSGHREGVLPSWRRYVARITELGGDPQVAIEMWLQIANGSEHPRIQEAALRNVERLEAMLRSDRPNGAPDQL